MINVFEKNKGIIFGLFLSTIIFKYAIANIFFAIMVIIFIIQSIYKKKVFFYRESLPILGYFLWGVLSLFWTTDFNATFKGIFSTLPFVLIPLLIAQYSFFSIKDLKKTISIFSVCLLLYFITCFGNALIHFLKDNNINHFFYHELTGIFENNAIYISLAVSVCIITTLNFPDNKKKDYIILFFLFVFLIFLSSKNIIITTFFLMMSSLYLSKNKKNHLKTFATLFLSLGLFVLIGFNSHLKTRFLNEMNVNIQFILNGQDFYNYKFSGFEIRLFQWRVMWEMIENGQVGFFGLGLYNVDYLLNQYFSYYNLYKGYFYINFHNQYLQTLGELGFVGLFLLLLIFVKAILNSIKYKSRYQILIILLFMVAFFTESFLSRQKGVYLFTSIYSLLIATRGYIIKE